MFTPDFFVSHWVELVFGLISAGAIAYCRYLFKGFQNYKKILEENKDEELAELIDKKMEPVLEELEETNQKFGQIRDSYKYRLIAMCQIYLDRGYMTSREYDQLSEMWKVYHGLGGNSQGEDYYKKASHLPIHD